MRIVAEQQAIFFARDWVRKAQAYLSFSYAEGEDAEPGSRDFRVSENTCDRTQVRP